MTVAPPQFGRTVQDAQRFLNEGGARTVMIAVRVSIDGLATHMPVSKDAVATTLSTKFKPDDPLPSHFERDTGLLWIGSREAIRAAEAAP
ncbi:hypothetical protein FHP25_24870 [Vineibacter terrae]|uniref:Uncharacterized protein n=1 Tax=Vineibacter terrae TaxID=2586908 RepID=A0A5C8PH62_9HYPH|nr:hypothetical protein [Vineibacter terrae]TXL72531.1 hypothetical protein FHP25_24870 [Vineibacter terrae]